MNDEAPDSSPTPITNVEKYLEYIFENFSSGGAIPPDILEVLEDFDERITALENGGGSENPFETQRWRDFKTLARYAGLAPFGDMNQTTLDTFMNERIRLNYNHFYVVTLDSSYIYFLCVNGTPITNTNGSISFTGAGSSYENGYTSINGRTRTSPINWSGYNVVIRDEFHA